MNEATGMAQRSPSWDENAAVDVEQEVEVPVLQPIPHDVVEVHGNDDHDAELAAEHMAELIKPEPIAAYTEGSESPEDAGRAPDDPLQNGIAAEKPRVEIAVTEDEEDPFIQQEYHDDQLDSAESTEKPHSFKLLIVAVVAGCVMMLYFVLSKRAIVGEGQRSRVETTPGPSRDQLKRLGNVPESFLNRIYHASLQSDAETQAFAKALLDDLEHGMDLVPKSLPETIYAPDMEDELLREFRVGEAFRPGQRIVSFEPAWIQRPNRIVYKGTVVLSEKKGIEDGEVAD